MLLSGEGIAKDMTELGLLEERITERHQHNEGYNMHMLCVTLCIRRIEGKYYCNPVRKNIKPYLEYSMRNPSFTKKDECKLE